MWAIFKDLLNLYQNYSFPIIAAAAAAKSLQSCPTLCDPIDPIDPIEKHQYSMLLLSRFSRVQLCATP